MGVFSTRNAINESYEEVDLLDESIDIAGVTSLEEGGMAKIVAETEINYTNMMKMIGVCELAAIEQTGDAIYEASDVSGFFGKIKAFFKNILEKIKRLFKNFLVKFDAFAKSGKDFVDKYKKQLTTANMKDFEFDGYEFSNLTKPGTVAPDTIRTAVKDANVNNNGDIIDSMTKTDAAGIVADVKAAATENNDVKASVVASVDAIEDKYDEIIDKMRGNMLGSNSGIESSDFAEELFKYYRSGDDSKKSLDNISLVTQMTLLTGYDKVKKETDREFNQINKDIQKYMDSLDKAENLLLKEIPDKSDEKKTAIASLAVKAISVCNRLVKDYQNCWNQRANAHLRALKDEAQQAKAICTKALTRKVAKESADLEDEGFGVTHSSAFDSLKLI